MRGVVLGSIVVLAACTPALKGPEVAPNDPNALDPSESAKRESSSEGDDSTPAPGQATASKSSTPPDEPARTKSASKSDSGPHVPDSFGGSRYDRAALEVILARAARQVKSNCGAATDDNGVASGPWGKTTFSVKLGHNGHSKGGTIPAPYDGKPTGNCVVKAFTNLIYAPFAGDDADVDWPVEMVKP
jgi:hypothetical protein